MIPVGKETQPGWNRGDRLADEQIVSYDRFFWIGTSSEGSKMFIAHCLIRSICCN
jgi:hypothetical protein